MSNSWTTGRQRKRAWFVVSFTGMNLFIDLIPVLVASLAKSEPNISRDNIMATRVLIFMTFSGVAITSTSVITALRHENGGSPGLRSRTQTMPPMRALSNNSHPLPLWKGRQGTMLSCSRGLCKAIQARRL
jgi:hypothetical protein